MAFLRLGLLLLAILSSSFVECRPPTRTGNAPQTPEVVNAPNSNISHQENVPVGVEYEKYLQEIVQTLENDPVFRKKLEQAKVEDIRSGNIANELEFAHHNVRTKLDEAKRKEMQRLLEIRQMQIAQGRGDPRLKGMPPPPSFDHLDMTKHKFDVKDLQKLITKTTNDLEAKDKERRDEFKRYEMEKEFEKRERLKHIENEEVRLSRLFFCPLWGLGLTKG